VPDQHPNEKQKIETEARDTGRKIKNIMIESIKQEIPRENPMIK
jgi:glycerate-2-kinase